jgi:drug/metabolite transporter (DMT)-like permease
VSPARRLHWAWISLALVWVVWGSTYLAIRVVVRELPPMAAASVRFFAAGLVMAALAAVVDRRHGWPGWRPLADYAFAGVLLLGIGNALVMWAERTIPSGITALIVATVPLWITLLDGFRRGGQRWTVSAWLGTLIGLAGVALIARPEGSVPAGHWPGIVALQIGALSWTVGTLYVQGVRVRLPVFTASAVEMLAGSLFLVVESRVFGEDLAAFRTASLTAWSALVYLVVFGSLVGFTAYAHAVNELPASTVGTYAYVNPVVAMVLGALVLREPLSAGLVLGGALIVTAVVLTTRRRNGARPAPTSAPASPQPASGSVVE